MSSPRYFSNFLHVCSVGLSKLLWERFLQFIGHMVVKTMEYEIALTPVDVEEDHTQTQVVLPVFVSEIQVCFWYWGKTLPE